MPIRWIRSAGAFAALLAASSVSAQQPLSPRDAVRLALEHNDYLAAAASRVAAAEGLRLQANLPLNPRLFLQSENARIPVGTPLHVWRDTDTFAYVSRVFETAGKRQRRTDVATENARSAKLTLEAWRAAVAGRVLTAYWNAAGAERLRSVLAESLDVLGQTVRFQRDRVREGALPEADLTRILLEYQQVAISLENARQDVTRSRLLLDREIGWQRTAEVMLTGDLGAVERIAPPSLEESVERRPDVRQAVQAVQQAQSAVRLQQAQARPDPELLFGYKRTLGLNTVVAGVQINLPFHNRNQGAIAAASAESAAAAATLRATRTAAKAEIEALLSEYLQKRDLVERMLPTLRQQADQTRRIAGAVYREGASDLLRLLDAERTRIQAETLHVRSLIDYRQAAINLQTALGQIP